MNPSHEQNRIEALLALEQLEEQAGQKGFGYHLNRFQELLKSLKMSESELEEINARLSAVQGSHRSGQTERSQIVRKTAEDKLAAARALFAPAEGSEAGEGTFQERQTRFQQAYDALEEIHQLLEFERQNLTREDRDTCWDALKASRNELRALRGEAAGQIEAQAEALFAEAKLAVEGRRFREAKEAFQALQRDVNQLPLRRDQRTQWRDRFNGLWEQLQASGKTQREAAQLRNADGQKRLEEALQRVETFITRKEEDLKTAEARMQDAHWHEVDPIEKQVARDKDALEDARRRQADLKAKIEDAKARKK